jgi:hypothetical protein
LPQGWGTRLAAELGGLFPGAGYSYAKQRLDWVWAAPVNETVAVNVSIGGGAHFVLWLRLGVSAGAGACTCPRRQARQASSMGVKSLTVTHPSH